MSVQRPSAANSFWYYLDYINPNHVQTIIQIVLSKLWRVSPQIDWTKAIKLEDRNLEGFVEIDELDEIPNNEPPILYKSPVYNVQFSPDILNKIQDDEVLKILLGHSPDSRVTFAALQTFCNKDQSFLSSAIYNANSKNAPLYKLVLDAYKEKPLRIDYAPEKIEVQINNNSIWMNCRYRGNIVTQENELIPFEAICNYNVLYPQYATRSLFIHYPERLT